MDSVRSVGHVEWSVVGQLALVAYVYAGMVKRRAWAELTLSVGFWAAEFLWEMLNALVLHFTQRAALWTVAGRSSYVIYVGLNIEIALMFALMPPVLFMLLPRNRGQRLWGLPLRLAVPVGLGLFCVAVECAFNRTGALRWYWPFWNWPHVWLIAVAYCAPLVLLTWIHHNVSRHIKTVGMGVALVTAVGSHLVLVNLLHLI